MTLVGTKLLIIGGSYGQDYLKDVFELDTDPCPEFDFGQKNTAPNKLATLLGEQRNKPEFSDISFLVEGKIYYAHKIIVSQLSERFKTMLTAGLQESQEQKTQVKIDDISYEIFSDMMTYLYTGRFDALDKMENKNLLLEKSVEYLRVADSEYLEDIKMVCERKLIELCNIQTFQLICDAADLYNANRLKEYCAWF